MLSIFASILTPTIATAVTFALIWDSEGPIDVLAVVVVFLILVASLTLILKRRDAFAATISALVVIDSFAIVLLSNTIVIVPWSILMAGIASISVGANAMSMWEMVKVRREVDPRFEAPSKRAIRRWTISVLFLVTTVMIISIIALALSTGVKILNFSLPLIAACVIAIMISLTLLVAERSEPDQT
jgi:hypothetical protein